MQGLPIQQSMKAPVKGAHSKSVAANTDENTSLLEGISSEASLENGSEISANKISGKVDFASLFEGAKNKSVASESSAKSGLVKNGNANLNVKEEQKSVLSNVKSNPLENVVAKSGSNLDQLLNNLKGTQDDSNESADVGNKTKNNVDKKGFFPNQKHTNPNNQNIEKNEKESPLDFLVKGSKENKVGMVEVQDGELAKGQLNTDKKSFFQHANKLEVSQDSNKPNLKLISSEDFVDHKSAVNSQSKNFELLGDKKSQIKNDQIKSQDNTIDMQLFAENMEKGKTQNISQINRYQSGQNLLNDSMIKNTKDLAFKENKKTKTSSIDELLSPDLKKANELSMIKDSPLPIMLTAKGNQNGEAALKMNNSQNVLDLSHINANNTQELIKQISDYTMQSSVAGKDHLDLTVTHEQLGQFQISVSKLQNQAPGQNQVDMQILTSSSEGHKFFVENEGALTRSLQQSGINLSDLRIVSSMSEASGNSFAESKQFSSFNQNQNGSSESHQSFQSFQSGDFKNGNERRKDLWNEYRERYGA